MNKYERTKTEKDGLDVYDDLMRAAHDGCEALDDGDILRLKWYGLYPHSSKDGHFMLRSKVVGGVLAAEQVDALASITEDYGRDVIDVTTRQCVQIHWITLDEIPDVFARLDAVGLTSTGACGDIPRNVVGCTLAGIAHEEIVDGHATAQAIHDHFFGNRLYSNLPRKFKVSVTGCREDCARGLINCVALSGATHDDGTPGFNLRVGGGLSAQPRFARSVDAFVTPGEAPRWWPPWRRSSATRRRTAGSAAARGSSSSSTTSGRMASASSSSSASATTCAARPASLPNLEGHDHIGTIPQHEPGLSAVGLCVPVGRLQARQLRELGRLARDYGSGELRLTHQQNALIPDVPDERVEALQAEPLAAELSPAPTLFTRGLQTYTGKEFCGLAKVHTKARAAEIAAFLDRHVTPNGHGDDFRLHFAGCSSSCAQHQIADVGIEGVLKKVDGQFIEAMDIRIGGRLGPSPTSATW